LAYSDDFTGFTRYSGNPLLTKKNKGNYPHGPNNPTALLEEGKWKIWFETGSGFGYVEIPNAF